MIPQQLKTEVKNTLTKIAKARPNSKYVSPSHPSQAEIDEFIIEATINRIAHLKKTNYRV